MTAHPARQVDRCRTCGGTNLLPFLDLGAMPPANAFLAKDELAGPEARYPLALCSCRDCSLIQLTHIVPPEALFRHYAYFSSMSVGMTRHFAAYAREVTERFVQANGLVVEIGSNDGVLLRSLLGKPLRVLGVDPAANVAERARAGGVPTIADFFSQRLADNVRREHGPASVIVANNVFAHIHDLDDVVRGLDGLLTPEGVFVFEVPYVVDFIEHLEFDTVYHEHLSYFGVQPLRRLFERFAMEVFEVAPQPVHGGTIRVFVRRKRDGAPAVDASVTTLVDSERAAAISDEGRLARFANDVAKLRDSLRTRLRALRASGKRVVGYTAPAKGIVLLNYCGLGPEDLSYLADSTPAKQGLYAPGARIPIVSPEHFQRDRPDYALLFAWNHAAEILEKERAWHEGGGRFILPIPEVRIV